MDRDITEEGMSYIDIVFEFHTSGAIQFHILQCRAHHIVGLALRLLSRLDSGGLVEIASIFHIKSVECILEGKDRALVELGKAPVANTTISSRAESTSS